MELISRNKANEIASYQISMECAMYRAIEYVNGLINKESRNGKFKTAVLCSQFNCNNEIRKDVCRFVIEELIEAGYKAKFGYHTDLSEDYISISWE